jgi:hypothetical protein
MVSRIYLALLAACSSGAPKPSTHDDARPLLADASLSDASPASPSRELAIPPRMQWTNADGYCGEMSIQSIALYDGAWISEQVVRNVAGGELLLGDNEDTALTALHLDHALWDSNGPKPQSQAFLTWIKTELEAGVPVIYGVYLTDGNNDPDYDHIVPAVGITASVAATYDPADMLALNDNFDDRVVRSIGSLAATRSSCASDTAHGGCVPRDVDYGVAVSGVTDAQHATLPVTLTVAGDSEPNVSTGASPLAMTGTVTVSGLVDGRSYALLRYDDLTAVPTNATAAEFLASSFTHRNDFVATGSTFTFVDPMTFQSSGVAYYRCVPRS